MKIARVRSLSKHLLPLIPGFRQNGWLLYATPIEHVLRGFCFDPSGFDKETFYLYVFIMPLYVPVSHIYFNFGERLRCRKGEAWNLANPQLLDELLSSIQRDGLPFLERVKQPAQVVDLVQQLPGDTNPHSLEAVAYALAMADDFPAARHTLDRMVKALDKSIPWQAEMIDRATQLGQKLLGNDPQEAKQQLAEWEQATKKNLGI